MGLQKPKETRRLKYLYVLLGRIAGLDEYSLEPKTNVQVDVDEFNRIYDKIYETPATDQSNKEDFFTLDSVLDGELTSEDKLYSNSSNRAPKRLKLPHKENIPIKGETIVHRAISFLHYKGGSNDKILYEIISKLVNKLPLLLNFDRRQTEYDGQTPLHLAVLKEDINIVEMITTKIVEKMENRDSFGYSLDPVAKGPKFKDTVMMAGSPLCVAALKFNKDIFKLLVNSGARIDKTNHNDDNMCHSLIRIANAQPESLDRVREMLEFILIERIKQGQPSDDIDKLLMMENKEGLNPLQLATKLRLHTLFKQLYESEVYCERNVRDCLRDDKWYDITEIETIPIDDKSVDSEDESHSTETEIKGDKPRSNRTQGHTSLLPTILLQRPQSAISFLEFPAVREVIEQKWNRYRWFLAVLGILHMVFLIVLTHSATIRTQLTNNPVNNPNESVSDPPNYKYRVAKNVYVTAICVTGLIYGLVCLIIETKRLVFNYTRKVIKKTPLVTFLKLSHSNVVYRWLFVLLSVFLIFDFILAVAHIERYANYFLISAVIVGWYTLLFFIQMIKPFSFFTSLIQTVMIDLVRFFVVMVTFLIGFTTAMYMAMQGANTEDDTFRQYDSALMKMFTIMLGLGEIDTLLLAREPAVAVIIFIMFVLLSTILLLNALLAIMANTCSSLLSRYGKFTALALHYRLQKLSAILLIEDVLPVKLQICVGEVRPRKRFIYDRWYPAIKRRILHHTSLTTKAPGEMYLPGIDTVVAYIKGRRDKKRKEHKRNTQTVNETETENTKNETERNDNRIHPDSSICVSGTPCELELKLDFKKRNLNIDTRLKTEPLDDQARNDTQKDTGDSVRYTSVRHKAT